MPSIMHLRIDVFLFREVVRLFAGVTDNVCIEVSDKTLRFVGIDGGHVVALVVSVDSEQLEEYTWSKDTVKFCISVDHLREFLDSLCDCVHSVNLDFYDPGPGERGYAHMTVLRPSCSYDVRKELIDPPDWAVPKLTPKTHIRLPASVFTDAMIFVAGHCSHDDTLVVTASGNGLRLQDRPRGNKESSASVSMPWSDTVSWNSRGEPVGQYNLECLLAIAKALPGEGNVDLLLDKDFPMVVQFVLTDNRGRGEYTLAPRIDVL